MSKESEKSLNHVSIVNNVTMTIDNSDSNNNDDDNQDEHVLNFDYEQSNQFEQQQEQRCLKNDHQDDVEEEIVTTKQIDYNTKMQNNSNNIGRKDEWENGQIDWLHQYQSDRIIDRLLTKF
uniref:CTD small phosphatase-like protein 2 n=1 Tax=Dermatophagoides pteronyssinus TaxID=6956 RepID=A0A6P6YDZ6_DERPT|nr:CTD small phosphatase-like protein 2 [Dermatophagoides pteronyssinus]